MIRKIMVYSMVNYDLVQNFIMQNFQNVTIKGMDFTAKCVLCGDSISHPRKRRFNLKYNPDSGGVYHCFNCGKSGSFIGLYAHIKGISRSDAGREIKKSSFKSIKTSWSQPQKIVKVPVVTNGYFNELRKDWIGLTDVPTGVVQKNFQTRLVEFLDKRCLPTSYPFYIAYAGPAKGRIIIPILDRNDNIIYYQARAMSSDTAQKYMNPTLTSKKVIILNEHKFDRNKYIMVTEGPIDAICIGDQGTCVFGSTIDDEILKKVLTLTDKGVIITLDNDKDGLKGTQKIITKSRYAKSLLYFKMPYPEVKDINQYVMENRRWTDIYTFVLQNSYNYLEYIVKSKME